jgi:hypothetical protein
VISVRLVAPLAISKSYGRRVNMTNIMVVHYDIGDTRRSDWMVHKLWSLKRGVQSSNECSWSKWMAQLDDIFGGFVSDLC